MRCRRYLLLHGINGILSTSTNLHVHEFEDHCFLRDSSDFFPTAIRFFPRAVRFFPRAIRSLQESADSSQRQCPAGAVQEQQLEMKPSIAMENGESKRMVKSNTSFSWKTDRKGPQRVKAEKHAKGAGHSCTHGWQATITESQRLDKTVSPCCCSRHATRAPASSATRTSSPATARPLA